MPSAVPTMLERVLVLIERLAVVTYDATAPHAFESEHLAIANEALALLKELRSPPARENGA